MQILRANDVAVWVQMFRRGVAGASALALGACGAPSDSTKQISSSGDVGAVTRAPRLAEADSLAATADSLVNAGRAWRATVLLAPALANPSTQTAERRLAGARAAAGWDGWAEAQRILKDAPWLDTQFDGEGRELLARSALETNTDALSDARLAFLDAKGKPASAVREVLLARAHDRANARDSASAHYLAASARLTRVADWLRLRAAGVADDSAQRAALLRRVVLPVARERFAETDAEARERSGDFAGAAAAYRRAGSDASAFRVEAFAARDSMSRLGVAKRIVAYLAASRPAATVRASLDVLDRLGPLDTRDAAIVGRAAASAAQFARSAAAFGRAAQLAALGNSDRMVYANALSRSGKIAEAIRLYESVANDGQRDPQVAPLAAYQRARLMAQSGNGAEARAALRDVATRYAENHAAAAPALLLLADLSVDDGEVTEAAAQLRELVTRHPTSTHAPLANFRLGLLELPRNPALAAQVFDSLSDRYPASDEALAAKYWAARSYDRAGRRTDAQSRWESIQRTSPMSYYGFLSAKRLGAPSWTPRAKQASVAHVAAIDSAVERITLLHQLGMDVEAGFENDALAERFKRSPSEAGAIAAALTSVGEPARALHVALAAMAAGDSSFAVLRAAYPIVHEDALAEEAKRNGLDPALVAGLIRQESSWNPRAVSVASARGLMQLLPSVGAAIAAQKKFPLWNVALLFEPDVSLQLGTAHLASSLTRGAPIARALAAYNAGGSRVSRWIRRPGADDDELFAEWIPFTETRDYVRVVQRNAAVYRAVY